MKLKKAEAIIKSAKSLILFHGDYSIDWISDGVACYPLYGLPKMSVSELMRMFDIPNEKTGDYRTEEAAFPAAYSISAVDESEALLTRYDDIRILMDGRRLLPLWCPEYGNVFIDEKYIKPFDDEASPELYARVDLTGQIYAVVKNGFTVDGVILPVSVSEKLYPMLEEIIKRSERN